MASVKQLILASESPFRRQLLASTGLAFRTTRPPVDEYAYTAADPAGVARVRAEAKALAAGPGHPESLLIGADQVLSLEGRAFDKVTSAGEARARLSQLSGRTHELHSAVALVYAQVAGAPRLVSTLLRTIVMPMRELTPEEIDAYVGTGEWQGSVGCYQFENRGISLFRRVEAEYSAIVGLPLQELLAELRRCGINALVQPKGPWELLTEASD